MTDIGHINLLGPAFYQSTLTGKSLILSASWRRPSGKFLSTAYSVDVFNCFVDLIDYEKAWRKVYIHVRSRATILRGQICREHGNVNTAHTNSCGSIIIRNFSFCNGLQRFPASETQVISGPHVPARSLGGYQFSSSARRIGLWYSYQNDA